MRGKITHGKEISQQECIRRLRVIVQGKSDVKNSEALGVKYSALRTWRQEAGILSVEKARAKLYELTGEGAPQTEFTDPEWTLPKPKKEEAPKEVLKEASGVLDMENFVEVKTNCLKSLPTIRIRERGAVDLSVAALKLLPEKTGYVKLYINNDRTMILMKPSDVGVRIGKERLSSVNLIELINKKIKLPASYIASWDDQQGCLVCKLIGGGHDHE